mmetsp:Transcript_6616/g.9974  ORF Transcript_6616/g.9974 Transcript_6616/m.9974 type:complete len:249 (-) Transcript_6616:440-1186(-)
MRRGSDPLRLRLVPFFPNWNIFVTFGLNIIQPQHFHFIERALVIFDQYLGVILWILDPYRPDETISKWVPQYDLEGKAFPFPQRAEFTQKFPELRLSGLPRAVVIGGAVPRKKWVPFDQVLLDFSQQAFQRCVHAAQGAHFQLELKLGKVKMARVRLQNVPREVAGVQNTQRVAGPLLRDLSSPFDLVALVPATLAVERHDDDLLEVGNIGHAHEGLAGEMAVGAEVVEVHSFLSHQSRRIFFLLAQT